MLTPEAAAEGRELQREQSPTPARAVRLQGAGLEAELEGVTRPTTHRARAPTDAEVRTELREARASLDRFRLYLNPRLLRTGPGRACSPTAPRWRPNRRPAREARDLAANQIAKFPYKWGGGHGAWRDNGYDCSGSVSFALAGAGLLDQPLTSGLLAGYGRPGPGRWITIYANSGHVFMVVAGLRFDTSGRGRAGTRWQEEDVSTGGFAVRHVPGL